MRLSAGAQIRQQWAARLFRDSRFGKLRHRLRRGPQKLREEVEGARIFGLAEPQNRLPAHVRVATGLRYADELRCGLISGKV